jgi:hypothetical protein
VALLTVAGGEVCGNRGTIGKDASGTGVARTKAAGFRPPPCFDECPRRFADELVLCSRRQRGQHARAGLAQLGLHRSTDGQDRILVLDEIAEVRVFLVADPGFQR